MSTPTITYRPVVRTIKVSHPARAIKVQQATRTVVVRKPGVAAIVSRPTVRVLKVAPVNRVVKVQQPAFRVIKMGVQGPPGIPGSGGGGGQVSTWQNNDAFAQTVGQAVYLSGAGGARLAKADDPSRANVVALVAQASIPTLTQGTYQTAGVLGGLSGIVADSTYYLSDATAGAITTTPPGTSGHLVTEIGVGVSPTELLIRTRFLLVL